MSIYTRKGDQGQTSLVGGQRVEKCCPRLEAYGTIDELNSHIGLLQSLCGEEEDRNFLSRVQRLLFVMGGNLATDSDAGEVPASLIITLENAQEVEKEIDRLQETLPPLRAFVLPAGCQAASQAHVCRTVCRRAERNILFLKQSGAAVDAHLLSLINRLSDYFFVLARHLNCIAGVPDIEW